MYEHGFEDASDVFTGVSRGSLVINLNGYGQGHDSDCMRFRVRAPNGAFGEPSVICRTDGDLYDLRDDTDSDEDADLTCTEQGLRVRDKPVDKLADGVEPTRTADPLQGCSALPSARDRRFSAAVALVMFAAGLLARRRAQRRVRAFADRSRSRETARSLGQKARANAW